MSLQKKPFRRDPSTELIYVGKRYSAESFHMGMYTLRFSAFQMIPALNHASAVINTFNFFLQGMLPRETVLLLHR